MKLVIEIPEEIYQDAIWSGYSHLYDDEVANAVADGKPLDSVLGEIRAEIENLPSELTYDGRRMIRRVRVYDILDKYKGEST